MREDQARILVVDDDLQLRKLLQRYLGEQGYRVATVGDGRSMDQYLRSQEVDLLILDLMLPGEDGLAIARRLRAEGEIPIIILSARGEDVDRIIGLEMGADDYLPKPFNPRELLARIRAVQRRRTSPAEAARDGGSVYRFGPFSLDLDAQSLDSTGAPIGLTRSEFGLLRIFVEHPNRVLSRDMLVERLKGYDRLPLDRSIDVRVTRLRHKIEPDPGAPIYIRTVWGEGYRFTPEPPELREPDGTA